MDPSPANPANPLILSSHPVSVRRFAEESPPLASRRPRNGATGSCRADGDAPPRLPRARGRAAFVAGRPAVQGTYIRAPGCRALLWPGRAAACLAGRPPAP
ncbi:hypothetical protein I4F81_003936 [Pyropia yezoensis]|uniref:Uncharacterized protein n=1 Tax=Pyropia yezoensis TaxID=2788 RepID=A0ACC3BU19_PYRYE|nr:hypothetical protein I4F81_003936 [Neopyropia yezoensis]